VKSKIGWVYLLSILITKVTILWHRGHERTKFWKHYMKQYTGVCIILETQWIDFEISSVKVVWRYKRNFRGFEIHVMLVKKKQSIVSNVAQEGGIKLKKYHENHPLIRG